MKTNCLRFYENWFVMAESRDTDEKRLAFYDAIMRYAFRGEIPAEPQRGKSKGPEWAAWDGFNASRPVIDCAFTKERAGRMGGMASGITRSKPGKEGIEAPHEAEVEAENEAENEADIEATSEAGVEAPLLLNIKEKDKIEIINRKHNMLSSADAETMFSSFWKAYPSVRKTDKPKCLKKFTAALKKSGDPVKTFNAIMDGLAYWKQCDIWTRDGGQFVCAPLVWLNNERYNDRPSGYAGKQADNIHHMDNAEVDGNAF